MKVVRLVTKCNEAFMTVVEKNEYLIAFAGKTEDPSAPAPSLESYLEAMTTRNDKIFASARKYINSADDKVSEFQEPRASIRSRDPSLMVSSKTSSQRTHDYVIAKMKREEIEKQNELAIGFAKQKKQMELDELEEDNRKRLTGATLQEFEFLDAVAKGSHSETTANARSSVRSEKVVQDWINTSLALSFSKEEKTSEPKVKIDPSECPSHNNGKTVEDQNTEISRHSISENCRSNYILSYETLQQLDPFILHLKILWLLLTQALYQHTNGRKCIKQANKARRFQVYLTKEPQIVTRLLYTHKGLHHHPFKSPFDHKSIKIIRPILTTRTTSNFRIQSS